MAIKASIVNLLMMMLGEVRRELVHGPEVHAMNIAFSGFSSAVGMWKIQWMKESQMNFPFMFAVLTSIFYFISQGKISFSSFIYPSLFCAFALDVFIIDGPFFR
jgi:hypothetical protein